MGSLHLALMSGQYLSVIECQGSKLAGVSRGRAVQGLHHCSCSLAAPGVSLAGGPMQAWSNFLRGAGLWLLQSPGPCRALQAHMSQNGSVSKMERWFK